MYIYKYILQIFAKNLSTSINMAKTIFIKKVPITRIHHLHQLPVKHKNVDQTLKGLLPLF